MAKKQNPTIQQKNTNKNTYSYIFTPAENLSAEAVIKTISSITLSEKQNVFVISDNLGQSKNFKEFTDNPNFHLYSSDNNKINFTEENISQLNENVVFINSTLLKEKLELSSISGALNNKLSGLYSELYSTTDNSVLKLNPNAFVLSKEMASYLLTSSFNISENTYKTILKSVNALGIKPEQEIIIQGSSPFSDKKIRWNPIDKLSFWVNWLINIPVQELKTKPHKNFTFLKESSLNRLAFTAIAFISFFVLSFLSFDAGISGDEGTLLTQAEKTYKFYATKGEDRTAIDTKGRDPMYLYGQSFDLITLAISKWFNIENIYELRHLFNTHLGWLTMLFASFIALAFMGWRAALFTFIAMLLSPRFLGHSWNNPKDIPFAFGMILTIYFTFKFVQHLPRISIRNLAFMALGLGITNSIRIGGLLLIAYMFFFVAIAYLSKIGLSNLFKGKNFSKATNLAFYVLLASIAGYFLGLILWPYGLINPLSHPFEALNQMTNFKISLRQLFEGKIVWSDNLPWYYAIKYMLITIPLYVFAGIIIGLGFIKVMLKKIKPYLLFLLFFAFAFPIVYTIYKDSNLYGGWRHLIFSYPPLVVLSSLGYNTVYEHFKSKNIRIAYIIILILLMIKPFIHNIKNHPYQYVYYNELIGGIKGAYGKYEMDYYFHSFKNASEWLIKEELSPKFNDSDKLIVRTNAGASYFFKDVSDYVDCQYMRYYDRANYDWDYAMIVNSYINSDQLKQKIWPPSNTIHTIDVDGYPICAILDRKTQLDYEAYQDYKKNDLASAISKYEKALQIVPDNEAALFNLSQIYQSTGQLDKAELSLKKLLKVYPKYDKALVSLGVVYLNKGELNKAAKLFTETIEQNPKYGPAYYYMGILYYNSKDLNTAIKYLNHAIKHTPRYKPAYLLMADIYTAMGNQNEAQRYINAANSLN